MPVERPRDIPSTPGVYEFVDGAGRTLYVGKAKHLQRRLASYFADTRHPRTERMISQATDVRWTVCTSEAEALVLEREWIRAKQPPYNIRLRNGGGYQGLAVTRGEMPRVHIWRGDRPQGADTYGPYPGVPARDLLDAVNLVFGVRSCDDTSYHHAHDSGRMCLLGETGKCLAPCVGQVTPTEHAEAARRLRRHLERPDQRLLRRITDEMERFAEAENFEAAARRRDQLRALSIIGQRQRIVQGSGWHRRAVVVRRDGTALVAVDVRVVDGVVQSVDIRVATDDPELTDTELLEVTVAQLDDGDGAHPTLGEHPTGTTRRPRGRRERDLVSFAVGQADEALRNPANRRHVHERTETALLRVAELVGSPRPVRRIETIDISHRGGTHAVGSLVVFVDGEPKPGQYRTVNLGDSGGDDYAAIAETVLRRLSGNRMGLTDDPDLLLIDGGPGQLAAAVRAASTAVPDGPRPVLAALAKRFEEIHLPGNPTPVRLPPDDPALLLLTATRDAAHDNGLRAHRRQRDRAALRNGLDAVDGLGPARRSALLQRFSTIDAVAVAPVDELVQVQGIGPELARRIHAAFHPPEPPTPTAR